MSNQVKGVHTAVSTSLSFAILFGVVGYSFAYVSGNPVVIPREPYIGFEGIEVTPGIAQQMGLDEARGILVARVLAGSPAEKAGLRASTELAVVDGRTIPVGGDVIVGIDGRSIATRADAERALQGVQVGDTLALSVVRGENTVTVRVIVEERPS